MKKNIVSALGLLAVAACGSTDKSVSLSLSIPVTDPNALATGVVAAPQADGLLLTDGDDNELLIASAEIVMREIEFEVAESTSDCDDDDVIVDGVEVEDDEQNDDCGEFEVGPLVVALPLDGSVEQVIGANIPDGSYEEIEFDIHKLEGDEDQALIDSRPDLEEQSVKVTGTYNGAAFTYLNDLNEEQELEFSPPIEVAAGTPINVTLSIDLTQWFADQGVLIDPATANKDGDNEEAVRDRIKDSIEGFEDEDEDGEDDHD